ncbi:LysR family transcriptional regulator [Cupriavidus respiraculi]|uniref:LysR family transcriptional regulator n=1 Tax=Cupriavidus respiraculi TaxID=195930 RepID=UPI001F1AE613|nr:LysR family transcriptional regulator [Cupriavidus respiraculi]
MSTTTPSARQIEIFRMVMRLGSAKRAAAALHISQPAVTQLLVQFETRSGLKLFDRLKGRLVPTPEARADGGSRTRLRGAGHGPAQDRHAALA